MAELIDLISSVTVLIAALAGISAIDKWKKERFDKTKIEAIEAYEISIKDISDHVDEILTHNFKEIIRKAAIARAIDDDQIQESEVQIFLNKKEVEVSRLGEKLVKAKRLLRNYSGYAGESMAFTYNYYYSNYEMMNSCLTWMFINRSGYKDFSEEDHVLYMIDFLTSEKTGVDIVDYMALQSVYSLLPFGGDAFFNHIDFRSDINKKILKILAAEKMRLHSAFLNKLFLSIKILMIKYRLSGRVVFASENFAVVIDSAGRVARRPTLKEKYYEIEKTTKRNIFFNLIKEHIKNIF